ncbi:MAG: hypothetical protein QOF62_1000 [Pyrinomonadaceae bacterium]|jgi:hypothetical protein|nr:hypothetical protein [Pyrinomonadaceae bacterium]
MLPVSCVIVILLLLICAPIPTQAQHERWQRVYTGEEFIVEINPESLSFEPGHTFRAQFRTVFSKPEPISRNSTTRYKIRLETVEFIATEKRYRYYETSLLDPAGAILQTSSSTSSQDWKQFKDGGMMARLFAAARALPPLGRWTVVGHRYGDGRADEATEPYELARLNGTLVILDVDMTAVGTQRCSSPSYRSHPLSDKEFFLKQGISLDSLGVKAIPFGGIVLECGTREWTPPRSLILALPSGNILMLWKGVFLEPKKRH